MSSRWQATLIRCRYEPRLLPYILAIVRVAICLVPQTGYLHPDEFFQSTDIVGGQYFDSQIQKTWEFMTDKPIRCMLIPVLLNKLAFSVVKLFCSNPNAYWLIVAPRLAYTIASFTVDYSLYKLCQYYSSRGLWYLPVSIIFQTSFICLGCLTRTLSNVIETIIFSLLLVVVCQTIKPRFRILFVTPTRSRPAHEVVKCSTQLTSSMLTGFILSLGTFNRPTFPCFAFVPMLYWSFECFKRNSYSLNLNLQRVLIPFIGSFSITSVMISTFDTYYYSVENEPWQLVTRAVYLLTKFEFKQLHNHIAEHWVFTLYNFVNYNSNTDNLAKYTLHPPYYHLLINVPLAFSILGLLFYNKLLNIMLGSAVYRLLFSTHRVYALMILSTIMPLILLSFIPHQEFRFLLPLIVPLSYAFSFNVYAKNLWLILWLLINVILTYFYATTHQAGVMSASFDLEPYLKAHQNESSGRPLIDVIALRCYLVPTYQWNIPKSDEFTRFDVQHTHENFAESLNDKIGLVLRRNHEFAGYHSLHNSSQHSIYIMLPSIYISQLKINLEHLIGRVLTEPEIVKQYWPHFTGEDFDLSLRYLRVHGIGSWRDAFGFSLLRTYIRNSLDGECPYKNAGTVD